MKTNPPTNLMDPQDPLSVAADKFVSGIEKLIHTAKTEEDLRIGCEKLLDPLLSSIGVESNPKYEQLSDKTKSSYRGRPDAIHGRVIIEYERPSSFSSQIVVNHAYDQLVDYMNEEAKIAVDSPGGATQGLVGIGFDGTGIFFVECKVKESEPQNHIQSNRFIRSDLYKFNSDSARKFLTLLRALSRIPLTAGNLADKFGPKSKIAPLAVSAFSDALKNWGNKKSETYFSEWKRLFGIVYGGQFGTATHVKGETLHEMYGVPFDVDFQQLLFSIHTYFTLLMKLIATELVTLKERAFKYSFSHSLSISLTSDLVGTLGEIESGGIFAKRGITNFLEGDFFSWYLNAFSPGVEEAIREITRELAEFEPATSTIDASSTRDLLKRLYQYLVPQEVRHNLGEYYTPDWLAEFLLDDLGYDGNTNTRVLDPACGSGTFIVLAVQRAKEFGRSRNEPQLETTKKIIDNIWGFDLNPLAVIATRTNYLFALGEIPENLAHLEIPVYLADSVLTPTRTTGNLFGDFLEIPTSVQVFRVPAVWVRDKGFLLGRAAPLIEEMVTAGLSPQDAMDRFSKEGLVFSPHQQVVQDFYADILELERVGKNGIWARFLKNAAAPTIANKFDIVVGNPPWIRWGYFSDEYKKATRHLWEKYGLFSLKGQAARLGGGEKDFSMLFTYAALDNYLTPKGKLGFLITQEVFKSKGAGEGFRRFRIGDGQKFCVLKAEDFVDVQPFEGAANKTSAIILQRGKPTKYPVTYNLWKRKKGVGRISQETPLREVLTKLDKKRLQANPLGTTVGPWQTISPSQKQLTKISGRNVYKAHIGARAEPYGVYWIEILEVRSDGNLIVRNLVEYGKREIQKVKEVIEPNLVHPAVRGADIRRWRAEPKIYIIMSQNPSTSEPYPESEMKRNWPRTFVYLSKFKTILLSRGSKVVRQLAERTSFYAMFGIGPYTVERYKIVWKRMSNDIVSAVISQHKTPFGFKTIIPTDTTSIFDTKSEIEAHYLCGILNSNPVREYIKSFSSAGRGFGTASVMSHVGIPMFNEKDKTHIGISNESKIMHKLVESEEETKVASHEILNDSLVRKLFGIDRK